MVWIWVCPPLEIIPLWDCSTRATWRALPSSVTKYLIYLETIIFAKSASILISPNPSQLPAMLSCFTFTKILLSKQNSTQFHLIALVYISETLGVSNFQKAKASTQVGGI